MVSLSMSVPFHSQCVVAILEVKPLGIGALIPPALLPSSFGESHKVVQHSFVCLSEWVNPSKRGRMDGVFRALPAGGKPRQSRLFYLDLHYI